MRLLLLLTFSLFIVSCAEKRHVIVGKVVSINESSCNIVLMNDSEDFTVSLSKDDMVHAERFLDKRVKIVYMKAYFQLKCGGSGIVSIDKL